MASRLPTCIQTMNPAVAAAPVAYLEELFQVVVSIPIMESLGPRCIDIFLLQPHERRFNRISHIRSQQINSGADQIPRLACMALAPAV